MIIARLGWCLTTMNICFAVNLCTYAFVVKSKIVSFSHENGSLKRQTLPKQNWKFDCGWQSQIVARPHISLLAPESTAWNSACYDALIVVIIRWQISEFFGNAVLRRWQSVDKWPRSVSRSYLQVYRSFRIRRLILRRDVPHVHCEYIDTHRSPASNNRICGNMAPRQYY